MFDIGFWEIAVIGVVALLVVGPDEFPAMVRNVSAWIGKFRRFMSDTKHELDREFSKADELKQLLEREASLAELHERVDARKIDMGSLEEKNKPPGQTTAQPVIETAPLETASATPSPPNPPPHDPAK